MYLLLDKSHDYMVAVDTYDTGDYLTKRGMLMPMSHKEAVDVLVKTMSIPSQTAQLMKRKRKFGVFAWHTWGIEYVGS